MDLLKLAVAGRCNDGGSREALAEVLSALGASNPTTKDMILELCVTEVCTMQSIWHLFWTTLYLAHMNRR